ncbi:MAG: PEP/pyruvate-binding domain-containing protein [Oligoflexales bacterium]
MSIVQMSALLILLLSFGCKPRHSKVKNEDSPEIVTSINSLEEFNMLSPPEFDDSVKWVMGFSKTAHPMFFMNGYHSDTHDGIMDLDGFPEADYPGLNDDNWYEMMTPPAPQLVAAGVLFYSPTLKIDAFPTGGFMAVKHYLSDEYTIDGCEDGESAKMKPEDLEQVVIEHKRLKETVPFMEGKFVMLIDCEAQVEANKDALKARGIPYMLYDDFFEFKNEPTTYNSAKSYGFLKYLTSQQYEDGEFTTKDILIFDDLPIDIGPLSGVITKRHQVSASHVYLRAKNQNIPNMFLPDGEDHQQIKSRLDHLVEFEAKVDGSFTVRAAEDFSGGQSELQSLADAYFGSRVPQLSEPQADLNNKNLYVWRNESPTRNLVKSYGAKGTNFALFDTALDKAGYNRDGYEGSFLIPFSYYKQHVSQKLSPPVCAIALKKCSEDFAEICSTANQACTSLAGQGRTVEEFLNEIGAPDNNNHMIADSKYRKAYLTYAKEVIENAPFNQASLNTIVNQIKAKYGTTERIRFRSSTNAEDLPGLTGAGLYESKAGCIADAGSMSEGPSACMTEKEVERTKSLIKRLEATGPTEHASLIKDLKKDLKKKSLIEDAIRKVYASLWNERAFLQRDYYRIDHKKIYMAILAHPSFSDESANGVVLIEEKHDRLRFNVVSQVDDISITNPIIKGAFPEQIVVTTTLQGQISTFDIVSNSNQNPIGGRVMSEESLKDLIQQLIVMRQKLEAEYGADYVKLLDSEFKLDGNRKVQMKQIRPF